MPPVMLSAWLRVIRVRFLLASVIAVSAGLAIAHRQGHAIDLLDGILTFAGVLALHASVDLLNDYWDHKRGIDATTKRTGMSGGTGVLPEGLLEPSAVYRAGIIFLMLGSAAGAYFTITHGIVIGVILGFAILSVYFYSTRIVDSGLGEFFVGLKGALVVVGAFYIQAGELSVASVAGGVLVGALSSLVLFIASFPDHDADKSKGRKTLVIITGKRRASRIFWAFPAVSYGALACGVASGLFPPLSLVMLFAAPLAIYAGLGLQKDYDSDRITVHMYRTLLFGRAAGALFVGGILAGSLV